MGGARRQRRSTLGAGREKERRKEGRKEGRNKGRKEGRQEGRQEGRKEGSKEGRKEGRREGRKKEIKERRKGRRKRGNDKFALGYLGKNSGSLQAGGGGEVGGRIKEEQIFTQWGKATAGMRLASSSSSLSSSS